MQQYWYILGISVQNFTQLGKRADFLRPFIWSRVYGLMPFHDGSDKGTASKFVHKTKKTKLHGLSPRKNYTD
jgi:hypothetical protein